MSRTKSQIKSEHGKQNQESLKRFLESSDVNTRRKIETLNQKGVSNWLTTLPIKNLGYELTKQEFWDAIRVRYDH